MSILKREKDSWRHPGFLTWEISFHSSSFTTRKQGTFLKDFILSGTEEYNWTIFLGTGTEECNMNL
jgi:hypothetical protein